MTNSRNDGGQPPKAGGPTSASSVSSASPSADASAACSEGGEGSQLRPSVEVTPEMIEAGFKVLAASGIADDYSGADRLLVDDIYRAMYLARPAPVGCRGTVQR